MRPTAPSIFQRDILKQAAKDAIKKLDPRSLSRNPVMFVTECCALLTTAAIFQKSRGEPLGFIGADLALAVGHGPVRQLRRSRGRRPGQGPGQFPAPEPAPGNSQSPAGGSVGRARCRPRSLRKNDLVAVGAGETIPADGEVIAGIATVDESAITGESAPVIRESGGDRSAVTGGTRVLSDRIIVRVTADPGESFIDRMISPGGGRQPPKNPERDRPDHPACPR